MDTADDAELPALTVANPPLPPPRKIVAPKVPEAREAAAQPKELAAESGSALAQALAVEQQIGRNGAGLRGWSRARFDVAVAALGVPTTRPAAGGGTERIGRQGQERGLIRLARRCVAAAKAKAPGGRPAGPSGP